MNPEANPVLQKWYREFRNYLAAVAYRMLGSFSDAEDIVQDVFVRLQSLPVSEIREAKSYLTKMTVSRSIDVLKSARRRRETYVGPWLPEPDVNGTENDPGDSVIIEESIHYALLVVMERLTPSERAVFLLRETFGFDYAEVAEALQMTEAACRKTLSRARKKLALSPPEPPVSISRGRELTARFLQAARSGKVEHLLAWIEKDAVCLSDGGGIEKAAIRPVIGAERVAAFIAGLLTKYSDVSISFAPLIVNGEPGLGVLENGEWSTVVSFEWRGNKIKRLFLIRNPQKLQGLLKLPKPQSTLN